MKKFIVFAVALVLVLGLAGVAFAGISGSKHDLATLDRAGTGSSQVCVFCHHPHRGVAPVGDANISNDLLWNMADFSQASYATYADSGSINATDIGVAINKDAPQSYLCMACHDGAIGQDALVTAPIDGTNISTSPTVGAQANLGTTLEDDHPVNMEYSVDEVTAGNLAANTATMVAGKYPLYAGKMQCGTCHDVHAGGTDSASSTSGLDFMRGDIVGSAICTECHTGK